MKHPFDIANRHPRADQFQVGQLLYACDKDIDSWEDVQTPAEACFVWVVCEDVDGHKGALPLCVGRLQDGKLPPVGPSGLADWLYENPEEAVRAALAYEEQYAAEIAAGIAQIKRVLRVAG